MGGQLYLLFFERVVFATRTLEGFDTRFLHKGIRLRTTSPSPISVWLGDWNVELCDWRLNQRCGLQPMHPLDRQLGARRRRSSISRVGLACWYTPIRIDNLHIMHILCIWMSKRVHGRSKIRRVSLRLASAFSSYTFWS